MDSTFWISVIIALYNYAQWDSILTHNHCLVCTPFNGFKYNNGCLVTSHLMQFMHLVQ